MKAQAVAVVVLVVAAALAGRALFPKTVKVPTPPRIVTQYDTVEVIDTTWVTRVVHDTVKAKPLPAEKVVVTVPVYVERAPKLVGITALSIAQAIGDSSLAVGFSLAPQDSGYALRRFTSQHYTTGPLRSLVLGADGLPRLSFYDPVPPPCTLGDKVEYGGIGGGISLGLYLLFHGH